MLKGLSRAGLGAIGSDEQFMELAAKYGFESVDTDAIGLVAHYGGAEQTKQYLKKYG